MKEHGFTLVELLAVMVILGIISMIVFPITTDVIKKSRDNAYNIQVNDIINASKKWLMENTDTVNEYDKTNKINLTLTTLKQEGYLKNTFIKNPKSKKYMAGCVVISYSNKSYQYDYKNIDTEYSKLTDDNKSEIENKEISGCGGYQGYIITYRVDNGEYTIDSRENSTEESALDTLNSKTGNSNTNYSYKGFETNNYVKIEGTTDMWRILGYSSQGIKLVNLGTIVGPNTLDNIIFNDSILKTTIVTELASYSDAIKNTVGLIIKDDYENSKDITTDNSYITPSSGTIWTMQDSTGDGNIWIIDNNGVEEVLYNNSDTRNIYPTILIDGATSVIDSGSGTANDPYIIKLSD